MAEKKAANKLLAMWAGPVAAAVMWFVLAAVGLKSPACWAAAVTTWCAVWWIFEPLPIEATSIIPFAVFPLTGVLNAKQAAAGYGHEMVMLFIGGFMIAQALEKSGAHKRLALGMVYAVGGKGGRRLILGFMLAAVVLSMWVSNTAVTLMLLPVVIAVIEQLEDNERKAMAVPLMLALVFGVNIGGIGTPVGTPPNIIFMGAYEKAVGRSLSFIGWMKVGVPVVAIVTPIAWLWLTRRLGKSRAIKLPELGPWRSEERRVLVVFILTALGWMFREEPYGGWSGWFGAKGAGDSTVALVSVMAMFLWPNGQGGRLLDWKTASNIPWGLLLMVGGSITIAAAFDTSGLSNSIGAALAGHSNWPVFAMVTAVAFGAGFITNMMNHTAMAALLMPLLAAASKSAGINPILLMMPAAMSISMAFMMPISTMSNMIIYGTGYISVRTMVREGFVPNLVGAATVAAVCYLLLPR